MMSEPARAWDVIVLGAGGRQAGAMLAAARRAGRLDRWLCVDITWEAERRNQVEQYGATVIKLDALADPSELRDLTAQSRLVANLVGPYFRTAGPVLDACIDTQTDYLDICDDADATVEILKRHEAATGAGVRALIGMGASPGVTNVFARAGHDAIGGADSVDISWSADARDASPAIVEHMWHIFEPWDPNGVRQAVPRWEDLRSRTVNFRGETGDQWLVELAHSELVTLPRFLGVRDVVNFGGVAPADFLVVAWAQARMGAGRDATERPGVMSYLPQIGHNSLARLGAELESTPRTPGGLRIDVTKAGRGLRFETSSMETMEESTGTPAAAGVLLMLEGLLPEPGVSAPEVLQPIDYFETLSKVSTGGAGSLDVHVIDNGQTCEKVRMSDVLNRTDSLTSLFTNGK